MQLAANTTAATPDNDYVMAPLFISGHFRFRASEASLAFLWRTASETLLQRGDHP